ncbi:MAG: hypothetical protein A2Z16_13435 [Chloroflexi bacterium RBG_16_54_18]|nr:MAG: hypothetical protein A2Z16_13435 [Chloroflexi bacterium RBG_16_54_18]
MIWYLMLSHLLADYPLQPTWMVNQKNRSRVLLTHAVMHFGVQILVVGTASLFIWPYLLLLSAVHLTIDWTKNKLSELWPKWVIFPYIVDQLLHYASIALIATWIERLRGRIELPIPRSWMIYAIAFLLVTYVWFISERILAYADVNYRKEVTEQQWSRMFARAIFLSGFLFFWRWVSGESLLSTLAFSLPYLNGKNGARALLTDLGVALAGMVFLLSAGA